jgi:hypothetical protein
LIYSFHIFHGATGARKGNQSMAKVKSKVKSKVKAMAPSQKPKISERDRKMAKFCLTCPVCKHARKQQKGAAFWFVKKIEGNLCPFCKAYERVYGKKSHQPIF